MSGEILVSHMRSVDILARPLRPAGGSGPPDVAQMARAKLNLIIAI